MDNISAHGNLLHIVEKVSILERLYYQVLLSCKNNRLPGYGTKTYFYTTTQLTYQETMTLISVFLKILNNEPITQPEANLNAQVDSHVKILSALSPRDDKLLFDEMINPFIDWLNSIINICGINQYIGVPYLATNNLSRIASRISVLEQLYNKVLISCSELTNYMTNYTSQGYSYGENYTLSFSETLNVIDTYLKFLSGQVVPIDDIMIPLYSALTPSFTGDTITFDTIIEPYITWLYNVLTQCRKTHEGIMTAQEHALALAYSPSGQIVQDISKRYKSTADKYYR